MFAERTKGKPASKIGKPFFTLMVEMGKRVDAQNHSY